MYKTSNQYVVRNTKIIKAFLLKPDTVTKQDFLCESAS